MSKAPSLKSLEQATSMLSAVVDSLQMKVCRSENLLQFSSDDDSDSSVEDLPTSYSDLLSKTALSTGLRVSSPLTLPTPFSPSKSSLKSP
ncbi:hypothetical protein RCL1_005353 [Eukaryota sp. TZLM3-RCL]